MHCKLLYVLQLNRLAVVFWCLRAQLKIYLSHAGKLCEVTLQIFNSWRIWCKIHTMLSLDLFSESIFEWLMICSWLLVVTISCTSFHSHFGKSNWQIISCWYVGNRDIMLKAMGKWPLGSLVGILVSLVDSFAGWLLQTLQPSNGKWMQNSSMLIRQR